MNNYSELWLDEEQNDLLWTLVRAQEAVERATRSDFVYNPSIVRTKGAIPLSKVREFIEAQTSSVTFEGRIFSSMDDVPPNWEQDLVFHQGLGGGVLAVLTLDIDALRLQGLIHFRDDTHFFVTPRGLHYCHSNLVQSKAPAPTVPLPILEEARPNPKVFISYTWESKEHVEWVRGLSTRLRADGVVVTLDQWELQPGDRMQLFMETAVRENDFVLVVCTPKYKIKSDNREGGAGYEGDIMTGEIGTGANHRKFIPILRLGPWVEAAPSWLVGKYHVNLSNTPYDESNYRDLLTTLHGRREVAPPIGPVPNLSNKVGISVNPEASGIVTRAVGESPIRILGIIVDEVTEPRHDGTDGSALYSVPFQLSRIPSDEWASLFVQTWNRPPEWTSMHRPDIARVVDGKIVLEGTTVEEVEQYHKRTLKLSVDRTNEVVWEAESKRQRVLEEEQLRREAHAKSVREAAERLRFDD